MENGTFVMAKPHRGHGREQGINNQGLISNFRAVLKQRAATENIPLKSIYDEESRRYVLRVIKRWKIVIGPNNSHSKIQCLIFFRIEKYLSLVDVVTSNTARINKHWRMFGKYKHLSSLNNLKLTHPTPVYWLINTL